MLLIYNVAPDWNTAMTEKTTVPSTSPFTVFLDPAAHYSIVFLLLFSTYVPCVSIIYDALAVKRWRYPTENWWTAAVEAVCIIYSLAMGFIEWIAKSFETLRFAGRLWQVLCGKKSLNWGRACEYWGLRCVLIWCNVMCYHHKPYFVPFVGGCLWIIYFFEKHMEFTQAFIS